MKLTNQEIARVFPMYLGRLIRFDYNSKYSENIRLGRSGILIGVVEDKAIFNPIRMNGEVDKRTQESLNISLCKLLLTPLEKISDEDAIEVAKIIDFHDGVGCIVIRDEEYLVVTDKYNDYPDDKNTLLIYHSVYELFSKDENGNVYEFDLCRMSYVHQYLISKGYDVPLFFAPTHWANGKTPIELGIAIDKTL